MGVFFGLEEMLFSRSARPSDDMAHCPPFPIAESLNDQLVQSNNFRRFVSSDWIFGHGRVNTDRNGILLKERNNAGILQFQARQTQVIFRRDRLLAQNRNRAHVKRNGRGEWI